MKLKDWQINNLMHYNNTVMSIDTNIEEAKKAWAKLGFQVEIIRKHHETHVTFTNRFVIDEFLLVNLIKYE